MKTIDEIRRERLALLKAEYGGVGKLAEQLEKSFSQVSQWINASTHSATGKTRGISDEQCRMIEEKCEKPRGWMDSDPDMIDVKVLMQVIAGFLQATESGQRQIIESVKAAEKVVR
ncbi:MAG TPA: hypothetical protein VJ654_14205 [Noviherbaspirillum sp.]|nr:hypothetical protein [Noviherbaspirillum sp.]